MRASIIIGVAFLLAGMFPAASLAERITLQGNYSAAHVKAACDKVGGDYTEDAGTNSYGCTSDCQNTGNNNTDQDHCVVTCSNNSTPGNCDGYTPGRLVNPSALDLKSFMSSATKKKTTN